jgi:hypothetical protein
MGGIGGEEVTEKEKIAIAWKAFVNFDYYDDLLSNKELKDNGWISYVDDIWAYVEECRRIGFDAFIKKYLKEGE